jgi:hypothetical protein
LCRSDFLGRADFIFTIDSLHRLNLDSNVLPMIAVCRRDFGGAKGARSNAGRNRGSEMANIELSGQEPADVEACIARGIVCASGQGDGAVDLVEAHKWFNIAAARGCQEAVAMRREVAEQMSDREIGLAQRAARDWLKAHPLPAAASSSDIRFAA